jgi:hypothetical protein
MELIGGILFLIVIGVLIDMARGRKPQFRLYHGQKLKPWEEPNERMAAFPRSSSVPNDGPGKFHITGVDRATKMDTTWYCDAASEANAKAKGELEGIIVTRVDRVK